MESRREILSVPELGEVVLVDSITQIRPSDVGKVIVTGSHGGVSAAAFARKVGAALYVFNDAGKGKENAGIAGLQELDKAGIAAITVSHESARIGDAHDALANGRISAANQSAIKLGTAEGQSVREVLAAMGKHLK